MADKAIIKTGNTFRIYDSSVETFNQLPLGTYKVQFVPMEGFSLQRVEDLTQGGEKVYGDHEKRLQRILSSYSRFDRSMGVMLSGDKGMGKSLMIRMLADKARDELGVPVIIVDQDAGGIADFIDSLGESLVIFDEFEKTFPTAGENGNRQHQFLGLFDGVSTHQRLYAITVNDLHDLSGFLINRPGRFHYHLRFDYPDAEQVRMYLHDQAPGASDQEIEHVVVFSRKVNLNYDHLRAIAFELNTGEPFYDIIGDLNIKRTTPPTYRVQVKLSDGRMLNTFDRIDLFGSTDEVRLGFHEHDEFFAFAIDPARVEEADGCLFVPGEAIIDLTENALDQLDDEETRDRPKPVHMALTLSGQTNIGY